MSFPQTRLRRLRRTEGLRTLVRETRLAVSALVMPVFVSGVDEGRSPIESLPGVDRVPVGEVAAEIGRIRESGVSAVILFGIPESKDGTGTGAYDSDGVVQRAVRAIKADHPGVTVITDVCLCEYTDHGHCGVLRGGEVDNDESLELIARTAVSHALAGADIVAPSDMMDGRIGVTRRRLDESGFPSTPILAYSAKYASAFYGPFRDAAGSTPSSGDRSGYQMDPPNVREAVREALLDIEEGADVVMVKPALPYLDVIARLRAATEAPIAAYHVSGEYAMLKAAAERGMLDERRAALEALIGIRRAGADIVITYYAREVAEWLQ